MRACVAFAAALLAACTDLGGLSGAGESTDAGGADAGTTPDAGDDTGPPLDGATCADTQSDAKNCGRCGHDCLGGACQMGVCAPVTLATGLNDAMGLAQDSNSLYVAVWGGSSIVQVAKGAGGANVLTTYAVNPASIAVALDAMGKASLVVWGEERSSGQARVGACAPPCSNATAVVAGGDEVMGVVVSGSAAYYTVQNNTSSDGIRRCDLPGCTNVVDVVRSLTNAYALALAGTGTLVYGSYSSLGEVGRVDVSGIGASKLFDASSPTAIATDGTNVFAALAGSSQIAKCALSGCIDGPTQLAVADNPHGVATDGKNVYWTNGRATGGSVAYCAVSGCPAGPGLLASAQANPFGIVVDDVAVYWVTSAPDGAVMKIAKP